jgi:hypothetical protein
MESNHAKAFILNRLPGGLVSGPLRFPRNLQSNQSGSIHDDHTARHFDLPGAPIAGIYHMDLFPPLLTSVVGDNWWRNGNLSLYFLIPTVEGEGVQGCTEKSPQHPGAGTAQFQAWVKSESGHVVAEGTAASGNPDEHSHLRQKIANMPPPREIRILDGLYAGKRAEGAAHHFEPAEYQRLIGHIVEPIPDYTPASPWPGQILAPSMMGDIAYYARTHLLGTKMIDSGVLQVVDLMGGLELQLLHGPMLLGRHYSLELEVLTIGESPKTEYFSYQCTMLDSTSGKQIAEFLMLLRFMKASSSLWP